MAEADIPYFRIVDPSSRGTVAVNDPSCLYLEVTNECNLTCKTCPLTYGKSEEPASLGLAQIQRLVSQLPHLKTAVLHGVGEPLLNRELPEIIQWLKGKGIHVLFNSNGTLMNRKWQAALVQSGLDEIRISLDTATPESFVRVRGKPVFDLVTKNVQGLVTFKAERGLSRPLVSLWLTGLRETLNELPAFVRLAHSLGVDRVYLQRLVYWDGDANDRLARPDQSLLNLPLEEDGKILQEAESLARDLGVQFEASGDHSPRASLTADAHARPWGACMRPWTLMYVSARGSCFPCCIAPFSTENLGNLSLGDAFEEDLATIWNGDRYREFRSQLLSSDPPECCKGCGVCWSL